MTDRSKRWFSACVTRDIKHDYYLSNASAKTPLKEFARVAKEEHRIEESIKRAKSEAGLADYQVRNWLGWHHHQILSLLRLALSMNGGLPTEARSLERRSEVGDH